VVHVDAVDPGRAPLFEVVGDLVGGADDAVGPLQHEGQVADRRLVVPRCLGRPPGVPLHAGELPEFAQRCVERQAARVDPGITERVQGDALQVEVALEFVVAANGVTMRVADDEGQPLGTVTRSVGLRRCSGCRRG